MNHETNGIGTRENVARLSDFPNRTAAINAGIRICRQQAKSSMGEWLWMVGNLPRESYDAVCCWVTHWHTGWDRLLHPPKVIRPTQDCCTDLRDTLDDAFLGRSVPIDYLARASMIEQFSIPKQYCFDLYDGIDRLLRFPGVADWDDLLVVGSKIGGSAVGGLVHILGLAHGECERATMRIGQALWITIVLSSLPQFHSTSSPMLAQGDFEQFGLESSGASLPHSEILWMQWVRWHCQQMEGLLREGSELLVHLEFDGVRVLRNLLGVLWQINLQWRLRPESVWQIKHGLSESDRFRLRTRFFLGLDPELTFAPTSSGNHH